MPPVPRSGRPRPRAPLRPDLPWGVSAASSARVARRLALGASVLRQVRHTIETLNSQLESMGVERLHARTILGMELKVHASLIALAVTNLNYSRTEKEQEQT